MLINGLMGDWRWECNWRRDHDWWRQVCKWHMSLVLGMLQHCRWILCLGNVMGYPGVFQSNPCPYPSKPVPMSMCTGFHRYGLRVYRNPWVPQPTWGYGSRHDQ